MGKPSGRFIDMRSEPDPATQSTINNHQSSISSSSVWILHSLRIRDDRGGIVPTGDRPYLICAHLTFLAQPKKNEIVFGVTIR
jgi:hypothetical protein